MTVNEMKLKLKTLGVRNDAYCLEGDIDEAYCLQRSSAGWYVYYSERGIESGRKDFHSESEACEYFLALIIDDSSTQ